MDGGVNFAMCTRDKSDHLPDKRTSSLVYLKLVSHLVTPRYNSAILASNPAVPWSAYSFLAPPTDSESVQ